MKWQVDKENTCSLSLCLLLSYSFFLSHLHFIFFPFCSAAACHTSQTKKGKANGSQVPVCVCVCVGVLEIRGTGEDRGRVDVTFPLILMLFVSLVSLIPCLLLPSFHYILLPDLPRLLLSHPFSPPLTVLFFSFVLSIHFFSSFPFHPV